jgi:DNA primase
MALPVAFLNELRAHTRLTTLIGGKVTLGDSGRSVKRCCPFHDGKSSSLHVDDDHFHCSACGAHGDAFAFVMQIEGIGSSEAVVRLAGGTGMEVPKP